VYLSHLRRASHRAFSFTSARAAPRRRSIITWWHRLRPAARNTCYFLAGATSHSSSAGEGEGGSRENRQYDRRIGALQNRENELWESNNHAAGAAAAAATQRQTAFVTSVQQQTKHAISEYSNDFRHVFDIRVLDVTDAWRAGYWFSAPALLVITSTYDVMFLPLSVRLSVCKITQKVVETNSYEIFLTDRQNKHSIFALIRITIGISSGIFTTAGLHWILRPAP